MSNTNSIIVAPATAAGGAIALIRVSGEGSIALCDKFFRGRKPLGDAHTHTAHYGTIVDGERTLDDVLVTIFRAPHSYTGEESVEVSVHGSRYIVAEIISLLCRGGARVAEAGEFSMRAFLAGRIDLSQAEAVADTIAADSRAAHTMAAVQMRGSYSTTLEELRQQLVKITSLLELELDFGEEEVEFANREQLYAMLNQTQDVVRHLANSFRTGNAIREGVCVAIVGEPNVGKSTLLNRLVGDDRAMVSDVAGTTRDTLEESRVIEDIRVRFIDTAGLHDTDDQLEQMGIERTNKAIKRADVIICVMEPDDQTFPEIELAEHQRLIRVVNKMDTTPQHDKEGVLYISARCGTNIDMLEKRLVELYDTAAINRGEAVVSNARHYDALRRTDAAIVAAKQGIEQQSWSECIAEDIRTATDALGEITGEITNAEILQSIFSNFCIGK